MEVIKSKNIAHNHQAQICWFSNTNTYDFVLVFDENRIRILDQGYTDREEIEKLWPEFLKECDKWICEEIARLV